MAVSDWAAGQAWVLERMVLGLGWAVWEWLEAGGVGQKLSRELAPVEVADSDLRV